MRGKLPLFDHAKSSGATVAATGRAPSLVRACSFSALRISTGLYMRFFHIRLHMSVPGSKSRQTGRLALGCMLLFTMFAMTFPAPAANAQTQTITVTQGVVNLGMTSAVVVTAPAAGTYTVVVVKPTGTKVSLNFTFTATGQTQNATLGNAASGFKAAVDQVGTYNIFLEQGSQVVGTTSLYATNKLNLSMDMVNGGTCWYIAGAQRGTKMFPRFYITYASNAAPITNFTKGIYVTYNYPDGTKLNATWHAKTAAAPDQGGSGGDTGFYIGKFQPTWNFTAVGPWIPTVVAADAFGNTVTYKYSGPAFNVTPATLATSVQLVDAKSAQLVSGLYNGQAVTVKATITYPASAEPVPGFVAPLDSTARGGVVNALIGWGFYNATTSSFGSAKSPGGLIGTVAMTYTGANGTWTGNFNAASLPSLQAGTNYMVVLSASDKASPPNTGFATLTLPAATIQTQTVTSTALSTSVSTLTSVTTAVSTAISTTIKTTISTAISTTTQNAVQNVEAIPTWAYAVMAVLLIVGLAIGYVARRPKR
jgi:hypothetical protein